MAAFTDQERQIYRYWAGAYGPDGERRPVFADPMAIYRRWVAARAKLGDPAAFLKRLGFADPAAEDYVPPDQVPDEAYLDALARVAPAIRETFRVPELHEAEGRPVGLTEEELAVLLADFFAYLDGLKNAPGTSPTSSTPSPGSAAAAGTATATVPPTPSSSASG